MSWATKWRHFEPTRITVGVANGLETRRDLTGGLHTPKQQHTTSLTPNRKRYTAKHQSRPRGCHGHVRELRNSKRTTERNEWDRMQTTTQMQCNAHDNMTWVNAHTHTTKRRNPKRRRTRNGIDEARDTYIAQKGKYYIRGITT